jgi:hypothetical protein
VKNVELGIYLEALTANVRLEKRTSLAQSYRSKGFIKLCLKFQRFLLAKFAKIMIALAKTIQYVFSQKN